MVVMMMVSLLVMVMIMAGLMVVLMMMVMLVIVLFLELANPGGGSGHFLEIEHPGVHQIFERHVAVVALYDFGSGLEGTDHGMHLVGLFAAYLRYLVEQDDVAEFNLLDHNGRRTRAGRHSVLGLYLLP